MKNLSNNSTITEKPEGLRQLRGKALWAALATLIDGEGSIYIVHDKRSTTYCTKIAIGTTSKEWMEAWQTRVGRGHVVPGDEYLDHPKWKQCFRWMIQKKADVIYICKRILPYLFLKVEQAQLAIDFIEKRDITWNRTGLPRIGRKISTQELAWREECRLKMCRLNAKGQPERLYVELPQDVEGDIVRTIEPSIESDANVLMN